MVNTDLVAAKLTELAERVARVRQHTRPTPEALAADRDALDLVSFNLMLAVQVCADVASHVIADEGWPPSGEVRGLFERLEEHAVITRETRLALSRAVGLRNIVAHGYGRIEPKMVHGAATTGLADLEAFAREVAAWMASSGPPPV